MLREAWPLLSIVSVVAVALFLVGCGAQSGGGLDPSGWDDEGWSESGGLFSGEDGEFTYELDL